MLSSRSRIKLIKFILSLCRAPNKACVFFRNQLLSLARDSKRNHSEHETSFLFRFGLEIFVIVALVAIFLGSIGPDFAARSLETYSAEPSVKIDSSRWRLYLGTTSGCEGELSTSCVGHPLNEKLWIDGGGLSLLNDFGTLQKLAGKKFWAGIEFTPQELLAAYKDGASSLELGIINASYRTFVNGELVDTGRGLDYYPETLSLSRRVLTSASPIRITIELTHDLKSRLPIWHPKEFGGFYSPEKARLHRSKWLFQGTYRHLVIIAWTFMSAVSFILLWLYVPRKVEYFFYSLFLLNYSLLRFIEMSPIAFGTRREPLYQGAYWLIAAEGVLGCLLGAVYARVNRIYLIWILAVGLLIGIAGFYSSSNTVELYWWKDALMKFSTPSFFLIGGIFCLSQSMLLKSEKPSLTSLRDVQIRISRLRVFGSILSVFAAVFFSESMDILSTQIQFAHQAIQLIIVVAIGIILLSEFRDRERQFEITQRSPFHEPFGGTASEVFGFVVSLDLKNSSLLSNHSAMQKTSYRPVTVWNTTIGRILSKHGGFKVSDEGDGFKILFEFEDDLVSLNKVLNALVEAERATSRLRRDLLASGLIPSEAKLEFRAGVVWGGLNPIWKEFLGVKTAEWEDAKGQTTFKDVTRIMDVEKQILEQEGDGSKVLVSTHHPIARCIDPTASRTLRVDVRDVGSKDLIQIILSKIGVESDAFPILNKSA